ncbi:MAG: hypothetical protein JO247_23980 [Chloroflexi bacterium]|nr:hypothetical protein [Chloroflexota bacterium]
MAGLLLVAPIPLMGLQSYGGEMLLRVYLFALAPMALFAALMFFPTPESRASWLKGAGIGVTTVAMLAGFLVARYGNERMDWVSTEELDGLKQMYAMAPTGSTLLAISPTPWQFEDYTDYKVDALPATQDILATSDANAVATAMQNDEASSGKPAYLVVSRSQEAQVDLFSNLPRSVSRLEVAMQRSGLFVPVIDNRDLRLYTLAPDVDSLASGLDAAAANETASALPDQVAKPVASSSEDLATAIQRDAELLRAGQQQAADVPPAAVIQPAAGIQPTAETQLRPDIQAAAAMQPFGDTVPAADVQQADGTPLATAGQLAANAQPSGDAQPAADAQEVQP